MERSAKQADDLAYYKNGQAAEAVISCYYCVWNVEDPGLWWRKKLRFIIKHMRRDHGLNTRVDCMFKDCTWSCEMGFACFTRYYKKDHGVVLNVKT